MNSYRNRVFALLSDVRWYVATAAALFVFGAVLAPFYPGPGLRMAEALFEAAQALEGRNLAQIALTLFLHNVLTVATTLVLGVILGLMPAAAALLNGWLAGVVLADQPLAVVVLLPHGIFELPAAFIGWGLGMWCGLWVMAPAPLAVLKARLFSSLWLLITLIVPLLAVAALIEAGLIALLSS